MQTSPLADVVARMDEIAKPLSRSDGVACFARLYSTVTRGVQAQLGDVVFADPGFVARLDVVFAELFFNAYDTFRREPSRTPRAWVPLFEARSRRGIAPVQFALAGMNAHINRDLPVALIDTCREFGVAPEEGSARHADFERVNGLLAAVEAQVKQQYLTGWWRTIARLVHRLDRLDDVIAMWDVGRARDAAWANAETLWALRDDAGLAAGYLEALDRMVGFAGRGLLVPADSWLRRLFLRF